ncbi:MAG: GIY-YIG nuclease family protein, partial [Pseudomonadota bacterium]
MKQPTVYIITDDEKSALYIGVTNTLTQRMYQHKNKEISGAGADGDLDKLVYFEQYGTMEAAILREKMLNEWQRKCKDKLIAEQNPKWRDLYP